MKLLFEIILSIQGSRYINIIRKLITILISKLNHVKVKIRHKNKKDVVLFKIILQEKYNIVIPKSF